MIRPPFAMPHTSAESDRSTESEERSWWLRHLWEITPLQDVFWFSLAALLLWLGYLLRGVFIPILIGFTAAYVVNPPLTWAQRTWHWPRSLLILVAWLAETAWLPKTTSPSWQSISSSNAAAFSLRCFGNRQKSSCQKTIQSSVDRQPKAHLVYSGQYACGEL